MSITEAMSKHRHSWEFIRTQTRERHVSRTCIASSVDAVIKCRRCGLVSVRKAKPHEGGSVL